MSLILLNIVQRNLKCIGKFFMSILRQLHLLSQQRVDLPDLRAIESAVASDFDNLAGKALAGRTPLIVRGFTIPVANSLSTPANNLVLNVASGILLHFGASESGTVFVVPDNTAAETLISTNSKVIGAFIPGTTNYVGLDLRRSADPSTSDVTKFLDANTNKEITKIVPRARLLQYRILINTQPFSVASNIAPVAKIVTDANNNIVSIEDARNLFFRLGSGSDNPNALSTFKWPDPTRFENNITFSSLSSTDPFSGGDKGIVSLKQWSDSVMTSLWESRGGEFWYSPVNRDNVKLLYGQPTLAANSDNFLFLNGILAPGSMSKANGTDLVVVTLTAQPFALNQLIDVGPGEVQGPGAAFAAGAFTVTVIGANTFSYHDLSTNTSGGPITNAAQQFATSFSWSGLSVMFENSSHITNAINNSVTNYPHGVAVPNNNCVYVDIQRGEGTLVPLVAVVKPIQQLSTSLIPGRRFILAWRSDSTAQPLIFVRDKAFEVGRPIPVATPTALGIVELAYTAGTPLTPIVLDLDANNAISVGTGSYTIAGNNHAINTTGGGAGAGLRAFGGSTSGAGVVSTGGAPNGIGVTGLGLGTGFGVQGFSDADTIAGVRGSSFAANGIGVQGVGTGTASGVDGTGGTTSGSGISGTGGAPNGSGITGQGTGTAPGVNGIGGGTAGAGVMGTGGGGSGTGVSGIGIGTAAGVTGTGGTTSGPGVSGTGGAPNGIGVKGQGTGSGAGVKALAGASGVALESNQTTPNNGSILLSGGNPTDTQGFTNILTPCSITKAWANISADGAGTVTLNDGFSITSAVKQTATSIRLTLAAPMANTTYGVWVEANDIHFSQHQAVIVDGSNVDIIGFSSTGTIYNFNGAGTAIVIYVRVEGRQ